MNIARFQVLDCLISRTNMVDASHAILQQVKSPHGGYVCFSNVHTVVTARKDSYLRDITNNSFMSLPDGKPLSIVGRLQGFKEVERVAGPDFMFYFLERTQHLRHFFYGTSPATLAKLIDNIKTHLPELTIVGSYSPPFRTLTTEEVGKINTMISSAKPQIVWVGLGAPKQEYWMAEHWRELSPAILLGVGAAFDFHGSAVSRAPIWVRRIGMEWFHRLLQDPKRLWKRYLATNSLFLLYILFDVLRAKKNPR